MSAVDTLRDALYGNPPQANFEPQREGVLNAFTELFGSIALSGLGAITVIKTTRALLNADLAHAADVVALVTSDATDANNDLYYKVGASGSGSWTLTTQLHDLVASLVGDSITIAEAAAAAAVLAGLASEHDAPQLLNIPLSAEIYGSGTAGTINADGSVTTPVSSGNAVIAALIPGNNGVANSSTFIFVADFSSAAQIANISTLYVQLKDATGANWSDAKTVNQAYLTKSLATVSFTKASGVTSLPAFARVEITTTSGGSVTGTYRLFKETAVPMIRKVPSVVEQRIVEALTDYSQPMPVSPLLNYQFTAASRLAIAAALVAATGGMSVDAVYGANGNAGTVAAKKQFIAAAISAGATGGAIGLTSGQRHVTTVDYSGGVSLMRQIHGIGGGAPAILDARQKLAITWVEDGSNPGCWTGTATHRFLPVVGVSVGSNTSIWAISRDYSTNRREWLDWKAGSVSVPANKAAVVAATSPSFTAWPHSTTSPEPRITTAQYDYDYYMKPGDGIDPNNEDYFINDIPVAMDFGDDSSNLEVIGSNWKDNTHTIYGTTPVVKLTNHIRQRCSQHANVGPCELEGFFFAVGQPAPGTEVTGGRTNGGAINMFPGQLGSTDIHHDLIWSVNFGIAAVYCHNDGTQPFFHDLTHEMIVSIDDANIFGFGYRTVLGVPGSTTILGDFVSNGIWAQGLGSSIIIPGAAYNLLQSKQGRSYVEFSSQSVDTQPSIVDLTNAPKACVIEYVDYDFVMPIEGGVRPSRFASIAKQAPWSNPAHFPTIILNGCRDLSPVQSNIVLWSSYGTPDYYNLILRGGSSFKDLSPNSAGYLRGKLTVEAGCTIGLGGLDRQGIRDYLDGLGVDHDIDDDTTIVDTNGVIIDYPA